MLTSTLLNPRVCYIEPLEHPEFLSQAVYHGQTPVPSKNPSEGLIDELLIYCHATNLRAKRMHLKTAHGIHRMGPIVIDERIQFVLFPITVSRTRNPFWINLHHFLQFQSTACGMTTIHFNHGMMKQVNVDYRMCEKQYEKALKVLDRSTKIKEQSTLYITQRPHITEF
ncbi:competence protein ComK [Salinicoccus sesuvii]|uniref:Competence protein ComK n=1 Tax=Salinicoccus sesuvii TaxID=868281 RepID=A0ABV7N6G1_9STAP